MTFDKTGARNAARGFLVRLRQDQRGNALAFMAAMLIPLMAFVGSAVDAARLYTVKTRLQQACDAGVLAGRKSMNGAVLDTSPSGQAQTFFNNNFRASWLGTANVVFTPSLTVDNQVQGIAQSDVPMTLMAIFGQPTRRLTVNCQARYDVADSDIMFVLDTTGSMACLPSDSNDTCNNYDVNNTVSDASGYYVTEKSGSRIAAVRSAVLNFFDTVTGQADQSTNFRFGFVPFSVAVNVGKLLQPLGYMATSWTYQSRDVTSDANNGSPATSNVSAANQTACTGSSSQASVTTRSPAKALTYDANGNAVNTTYSWSNSQCTKTIQNLIPNWTYRPESNFPVSQFLNTQLGTTISNPAQVNSATTYWQGCVEERGTTSGVSSPDPSNPPLDLDVDTLPSGPSAATPGSPTNSYWGPLWPDVQFARLSNNEVTSATRDIAMRPYNGSMTPANYNYAYLIEDIACPLQASRLNNIQLPGNTNSSTRSSSVATARAAIQNYMLASNGYRPFGRTYLDAGMTWGTRLLSATGLFKNDTAAWPGHNSPNRYLIFLTDGTMESDCYADASHGIEQYDQRVMSSTCSSDLDNYHYNRLSAACTIARNHNMTVFVILFGQSVPGGLPAQFTACASPGDAFYASDSTSLNAAFSKIAQQVAMLRISK